mmetsp:Transcript_85635/g.142996  ORF Transcript_85635/g.142996 Transcript_85635/m.142996 type:complete len:104 (-) Transcript_85635:131-442(-)
MESQRPPLPGQWHCREHLSRQAKENGNASKDGNSPASATRSKGLCVERVCALRVWERRQPVTHQLAASCLPPPLRAGPEKTPCGSPAHDYESRRKTWNAKGAA